MPQLSTCLWFDKEAEEAANFYMTVFKDGKILSSARYSEVGQEIHKQEPGSVMTMDFELLGHRFLGLNGGPVFKFNEAVSFVVTCEDQVEVDYYWEKLSAVPESEQCGWLKDKFGVSWQIVPKRMNELLSDPDTSKAQKAMAAMMQMKKLDVAELEKAFNS